MIVTVTANPALDVTYTIEDGLRVGSEHRVRTARVRPGGKGVNVARVLHALGVPVLATGLTGGPGGEELLAGLAECGVTGDFVAALPDVRRTVVVNDGAGAVTSFWEAGSSPGDPRRAAQRLRRHVSDLLETADALAVCGSLPPGVDPELPAALAREAARRGVPVVVDTHGAALRAAAAAGDAVLMPNAAELAAISGSRPADPVEAVAMAGELVAGNGLPAVVVTVGADGMVVAHPGGTARARPASPLRGNPTGAGDAACAAIVRHLAASGPAVDWPAALADAVALSGAAVLSPAAGEIDPPAYRRLLAGGTQGTEPST